MKIPNEKENQCQCLCCQHGRGEITKEHYICGMTNRLEVWQIVRDYFNSNREISDPHGLWQNVSYGIDNIQALLADIEEPSNENP